MEIEASRALSMQLEVMSRPPQVRGPGWDCGILHIAEMDNMGYYATRLHRMGQAGRPGLQQVEGRDYRGQSLKVCRYGNVPFRTVTTRKPWCFTQIHNSPF